MDTIEADGFPLFFRYIHPRPIAQLRMSVGFLGRPQPTGGTNIFIKLQ